MPTGQCGLCRANAELLDSHLLPKAFYKLLSSKAKADGATNTNPVVITPRIAIQISEQVSDYFLCAGCEDLLNKRGEKWIIANCWRSESDFPIHSALANATPIAAKNGLQVYAGKSVARVDVPQIVHFGAGVFWRAGARQWSPIAGHAPLKLSLGPYEEQLRLFTTGEAEFPKDAVLLVTVNSSTEAADNLSFCFPYCRSTTGGFRQHLFSIPGMVFQLLLGRAIPTDNRNGCVVRSSGHLICFSGIDFVMTQFGQVASKVTRKGSLA